MNFAHPVNRAALALVLCALTSACAIGNRDNRPTLNLLDEHLAPSSTAGRWALAPIALPVGLVAGVADAAVVRPLTQLDDAWFDTVDVLWEFEHDSAFRAVLLTPLSAIATPVVYAGSWVGRSLFDIPDHPDLVEPDLPRDEPAEPTEGEEEGGR